MRYLGVLFFTLYAIIAFSAQAEELITYSIQRPPAFFTYKNAEWQRLNIPAAHLSGQADKMSLTRHKKVLYHVNSAKSWDWFELDLVSKKTKPVAKSNWFKQGFLKVLPEQRSDGSYYALVLKRFDTDVYRVSSRGPKLFLRKPGLYNFVSLPDGSYAYSIWNGRGTESPDFVDYIPGRKMKLYHKPLKGAVRLIGQFDTVAQLQAAKGHLLFFTPGQKVGKKTWKLMSVSLDSQQASVVAEIPKSTSRGAPDLLSWANSSWIAYAKEMPAKYYLPAPFVRHQLETDQFHSMGSHTSYLFSKGKGVSGFFSFISTVKGNKSVVTYDLTTGHDVSLIKVEGKKIHPDTLMYVNSRGIHKR